MVVVVWTGALKYAKYPIFLRMCRLALSQFMGYFSPGENAPASPAFFLLLAAGRRARAAAGSPISVGVQFDDI